MKVQQLIDKYGEKFKLISKDYPYDRALSELWYDIKNLDERQPVKVPQCVHKYIREAKEYNWDLQDLMKSIDDEDSEELQRWFYHECNQETLARAWLDGYEVEEEKRYLVKIRATKHYFVRDGNRKIFFSLEYKSRFTKKELEDAGFGWVFDCPGIEIEEVE